MPRKSVVLIAAAAALSSAVVAANIARSRAPYQTAVDFDHTFTAAGASAEAVSTKLDAEKLRQSGVRRIDLTR